MKKYIAAIIAASLIGTPAFAAPNHGPNDRGRVEQSQKHEQHRGAPKKFDGRADAGRSMHKVAWKKGDRFDKRQVANYRVIDNPRSHNLGNAPRGHQWVRSGDDAVLIGITSGVVAAVMANVLH